MQYYSVVFNLIISSIGMLQSRVSLQIYTYQRVILFMFFNYTYNIIYVYIYIVQEFSTFRFAIRTAVWAQITFQNLHLYDLCILRILTLRSRYLINAYRFKKCNDTAFLAYVCCSYTRDSLEFSLLAVGPNIRTGRL